MSKIRIVVVGCLYSLAIGITVPVAAGVVGAAVGRLVFTVAGGADGSTARAAELGITWATVGAVAGLVWSALCAWAAWAAVQGDGAKAPPASPQGGDPDTLGTWGE